MLLQAVNDAGLEEVPALAEALAAGQQPRVVGQPGDEAGHPIERRGVVERAVRGVGGVRTGCDLRLGLFGQCVGEVAVDPGPHQYASRLRAVLARVEVAGDGDGLSRLLWIGVV